MVRGGGPRSEAPYIPIPPPTGLRDGESVPPPAQFGAAQRSPLPAARSGACPPTPPSPKIPLCPLPCPVHPSPPPPPALFRPVHTPFPPPPPPPRRFPVGRSAAERGDVAVLRSVLLLRRHRGSIAEPRGARGRNAAHPRLGRHGALSGVARLRPRRFPFKSRSGGGVPLRTAAFKTAASPF